MSTPISPLLPLERGFLYAFGVLRFMPYQPPIEPRKKPASIHGQIRTMAEIYLREPGGYTMVEYAELHRLDYDSFKGACRRLRHERKAAA